MRPGAKAVARSGDGLRLLRLRRERRSPGLSQFTKFSADFDGELGCGPVPVRLAHVLYALKWREILVDIGVFDLLRIGRKIVWRLGGFLRNAGVARRRTFALGDAHQAFSAVPGLIDPQQRAGSETRIAADHEDDELDPRLFIIQRRPGGAGEFERRERAIVFEISSIDHRTVLVSEIARRRDIGETRAIVRRRACPNVLSQHVQRVEAVEKHVAFDQDMAGDDPLAGFLMRGVEEKDRSPPGRLLLIRGCVLSVAKEAQKGSRQQAVACMLEAFFERRAAIVLTEIRQKTRRRVHEYQARKSGREEILGQKLRRRRACRVARLAFALVALRQRRLKGGRADAAAGDAADGEEIGAHAALGLEILLEPLENCRRPVSGADAAASRRDDKHRHGPVAMRLRIGGLRLLVPGARRGGDGRPFVRQGRH